MPKVDCDREVHHIICWGCRVLYFLSFLQKVLVAIPFYSDMCLDQGAYQRHYAHCVLHTVCYHLGPHNHQEEFSKITKSLSKNSQHWSNDCKICFSADSQIMQTQMAFCKVDGGSTTPHVALQCLKLCHIHSL